MKMNKIIKLKDDKGFTATDITIAIIIMLIFISIITTAYYNYYLTITSKNRNAVATNCIIDVIENVEMMNYEDITEDTVKAKIQELYDDNILPQQYVVEATVEKYNETDGNTSKKDLIKTITVTVEYKTGKKTQRLEISRLITKK